LWVDLARQCTKKRDEFRLLLRAQAEVFDVLREPWVLDATPVVEGDDILERLLAAVMHVRAALGHVSERRRFEGALVRLDLGNEVAAEVGARLLHADADVAVSLVGEVEPNMAGDAARLALEEREPLLRCWRERCLVASAESVIGRVPG